MAKFSREAALDRVEAILDTVEAEMMPVPVREVWVYGDVALGLDPIDRLAVYVTKDVLFHGEDARAEEFEAEYGVKGVGQSVRAEWADRYPEFLRANPNGYAAPELCLAAHLLVEDEPVHLEVCNTGFEDNVTQRLRAAEARDAYGEIVDPRGVCLWVDGRRSEEALRKLRAGELVLPTLPDALEMLGLDAGAAETAAETLQEGKESQGGRSVRGDVV